MLRGLLVALGTIVFSLGLIAVSEGEFIAEMTSKQTIDKMVDEIINEQYAENAQEISRMCREYLNTTCDTLDESINAVCNYASRLEKETLEQIEAACKAINEECGSIDEGEAKICAAYGEESDACRIVRQSKEYLLGAKNTCAQLTEARNQLSKEKERIYSAEIIPGVSIKRLHVLSDSFFSAGLLSLAAGCLLIYLSKRNIASSLKVVFYVTLVTGVFYFFTGEYGGKAVLSSLFPRAEELPNALQGYVNEMLAHQTSTGINLIALGAVGLVFAYALGRMGRRDEH